jgi:thioredoxin reductase
MSTGKPDVVIIGSGPAGLHAAIELRRRFGHTVLILERDTEPGGVPRWCNHYTFPCRVRKWLFRGPEYARVWTDAARASGASILTGVTALRLVDNQPSVDTTSPNGLATFDARAILLATGARESHRHNRLIAGDRAAGIFTTASLFQFLYRNGALPAKRFVVFGSEDVSYSCVNVILGHGGRVVAVLEPAPQTRSYGAVQWYFENLRSVKHFFSIEDFTIYGPNAVSYVTFRSPGSDADQFLDCDAVVFTGGFTPNAELIRPSSVAFNFNTRGPSVNQVFQTSVPWIFAAGNCLRGVVSGDEAAFEGRQAASAIAAYLEGRLTSGLEHKLIVEPPLAYCFPDRLTSATGGVGQVAIWSQIHCRNVTLLAKQSSRIVWRKQFARIQPGRRFFVPISGLELQGWEQVHFSLD